MFTRIRYWLVNKLLDSNTFQTPPAALRNPTAEITATLQAEITRMVSIMEEIERHRHEEMQGVLAVASASHPAPPVAHTPPPAAFAAPEYLTAQEIQERDVRKIVTDQLLANESAILS